MLAGRWLIAADAISGLLSTAVVQVPQLGGLLGTVPRGRKEWLRIAALGVMPLAAIEICKAWLQARRQT